MLTYREKEVADQFQNWKAHFMLIDYFEDKQRLSELKIRNTFKQTLESTKEIEELEKKIKTFISSLNKEQLQQIIYMSLDFEDLSV